MSVHIAGMGWVTPLGSGVTAVWERLLAQEQPTAEPITDSINQRSYRAFRVPAAALSAASAYPRLRRSSAISRFAVVAGLAALDDAGVRSPTADQIIEENADARIAGLRAALVVLALLAVLAIIAARRLPNVQPSDPRFADAVRPVDPEAPDNSPQPASASPAPAD